MPIFTLAECRPQCDTAITLGTFDGFHLGHRALLDRTKQLAQSQGLQALALVFRQPPQNYVGLPKPLILPTPKKFETLEKLVDLVVVVDFPEIGWLEAEAFVERVLAQQLRARAIVIGPDARFGKDRRGDTQLLQKLGARLGFSAAVIPRVVVAGEAVSSSAIREHLSAGRIEQARALLGYPPQLFGQVIRGDGRGHALGYPTANLQIAAGVLLPAAGVYAARVLVQARLKDGALYIGRRATFAQAAPSVEVHLFDTDEQLYGLELAVQLHARLRDDARFASPGALQAQIAEDIKAARARLRQC